MCNSEHYPAELTIEFPEDGLSRVSTFFRGLLVIPGEIVAVLLAFLVVIIMPFLVLYILFAGRYPRRIFEIELAIMRFAYKHAAYVYLLTDRWVFDSDNHPVSITVEYPQPDGQVVRWLPLVKWILVVPHALILWGWSIAALLLLPILWIYILITGHMSEGLFTLYSNLLRWNFRMDVYCNCLIVDQYPPFGNPPAATG